MHALGADLQLDALVARADDGGVDRLVVVVLGGRNVVLEAAGNDAPRGVHDAERAVAVLLLGHDDAEAVNVGKLLERDLLVLHLAPDGIRLLLAAGDHGRDLVLGELAVSSRLDLVDEALVALAQGVEPRHHRLVALRGGASGRTDPPARPSAPECPCGRRGAHRCPWSPAAMRLRFSGLHVFERTHVVQTVGELDEQHADVARNGDQQLAEVLGLLGLLADEIELADLGEAVDKRADLARRTARRSRRGGVGVLDGVVKERRGDGGVVERISVRMAATSSGWEK